MTTGLASVDVQAAWSDDPLEFAPSWTSLGRDPTNIEIVRGKDPSAPFYDTGQLTVDLDDTNGDYTVINAGGAHAGALTTYRQMRVIATDSGSTTRNLIRGHVIPRGWTNRPVLPGIATTTVKAADIFQMLGRADIPVADPPTDDYDDTQTRFGNALLNVSALLVNWARWLAPSGTTGTLLGPTGYGGKLLTYLQQMALSDGGEVWCDKDGLAVLEQGLNVFYDTDRTTPQYVFDDTGGGSVIRFEEVIPDYAYDLINRTRLAGMTGNVQENTDLTVASITGITNTVEHLDLFTRSDPDVVARGVRTVAEYSQDYPGPVSLTFEAAESTLAMDAAINLELRQRVTVKYTPPHCSQTTGDFFVEQIKLTIPVQQSPNSCKVTLLLSPAARLATIAAQVPFFTLNDATVGKLNTGRLAW